MTFDYDQAIRDQLPEYRVGRRVNALVRLVYDDKNAARVLGTILSAELVERDDEAMRLPNIRVRLRGDDGVEYTKNAFSGFYSNIVLLDSPMTPTPGTLIRFPQTGRTATVTHLTARGFAYKDNDGPHSFIARWGMSFTGIGEIYTDIPEWDQALRIGLYEILDNHVNPLDHEQTK